MLNSNHFLANKKEISLQDLRNTNNIIMENYIPNIIIEELKKYKINSNINLKDYSPAMLKLWVKEQAGIALTFDSEICHDKLIFKLIKELNIKISYSILLKKEKYLTDNIKNFIDIINQEYSIKNN